MNQNHDTVTVDSELKKSNEEVFLENEEHSKLDSYLKMFRGYIYALLFAFFTSISDILIKLVLIKLL